MEKNWKLWPHDDCPNCGSAVEVLSEFPAESKWVYDGEEVRCENKCGFVSWIEISGDDDDHAMMNWEGNMDELEEKL